MRLTVLLMLAAAGLLSCDPKNSGAETRSLGEIAFRARCQSCHSLPHPTKHTDSEWPILVRKYGGRAKLGDSAIALITTYLTSHN